MRYILQLLLCAFALTCMCHACADTLGTVVFVKQVGNEDDARSDVYSQDVPGGTPQLLLEHAKLPPAFRGRIEEASLSADAAYLLLQESDGYLIRNPATGTTRLMLGNGYYLQSPEKMIEHFTGGSWMQERATGRVWRLSPKDANGQASFLPHAWSPAGHLLLGASKGSVLRLYDPEKQTWRNLRTVKGIVKSDWLPDGKAVLSIEEQSEKAYRIVETPLAGKSRLLFMRPLWLLAVAVSADKQYFALVDAQGFHLYHRTGQLQRNIPIPVGKDWPEASLAFSPYGERLGIISAGTVGEPHIFHHEELWVAGVDADTQQRLAQWDVTYGSDIGGDPVHRLLGWTPDAATLIVQERPGTGDTKAVHRWSKLLLIPTTQNVQPTVLFDSGPYVISMDWHPTQ